MGKCITIYQENTWLNRRATNKGKRHGHEGEPCTRSQPPTKVRVMNHGQSHIP